MSERTPPYCRSCGAEITWVECVNTGKPLPLDRQPVAKGNIVIDPLDPHGTHAIYLTRHDRPAADVPRYASHFATCPDAIRWRRKLKGPRNDLATMAPLFGDEPATGERAGGVRRDRLSGAERP